MFNIIYTVCDDPSIINLYGWDFFTGAGSLARAVEKATAERAYLNLIGAQRVEIRTADAPTLTYRILWQSDVWRAWEQANPGAVKAAAGLVA